MNQLIPCGPNETYEYTNEAGQKILVSLLNDCGFVNGFEKKWRKVIAKPIGFNNAPNMHIDFQSLVKV